MDDEWDADNFEPEVPTTLTTSNKWEGEDEDEDVKESWEDDEEEKKDEEKKEIVAPQKVKPKKTLADKIAEKERLQQDEMERKQAEIEEQMTPEEKIAEKLRQQQLQEESDLTMAMETFGIPDGVGGGRLDSFQPTTKAEFDEFADLLSKKISLYKQRDEFPAFIEELVRNVTAHLNSLDLKRLKSTIDNMYVEKQKAEKGEKAKKPTKGKAKAKLRVEGDNDFTNFNDYKDDYDDFM